MAKKYNEKAVFPITNEQIDQLREFFPNIDELILDAKKMNEAASDKLVELLDDNYDPTPACTRLEHLWDYICWQSRHPDEDD